MAFLEEKVYPFLASPNVRRAALLFSARAVNPMVSLLYSLIVPRILTVEDFGVYSWALARIFVVQAFAEVGLQQSLVRFLAPALSRGETGNFHSILRASLQLKFYAFAVAVLLVGAYLTLLALAGEVTGFGTVAAFFGSTHPDMMPLVWFILLGGFGLSILTYLDAVLVAHEEFTRLSFWLPSVGVIRFLLLALFLVNHGGKLRADHVLFAFALGPYLSIVLFFFLYPASTFLHRPAKEDWKPWVGRLLKFNSYMMIAAFMAIVSDWMEVLIISEPDDNGHFNAARLPMQGFLILLATMNSLLLPRFSQLETPEQFRDFFRRIYQLLIPGFVIFLPGFWLFPWFIREWFGPDFLISIKVFYILYPNFILRIYFAPLGVALVALDQPRLIAIEAGLRMMAGFVLNMILYPTEGIIGAAWASLMAQAVGWAFLLYCYRTFFMQGKFPFHRDRPE